MVNLAGITALLSVPILIATDPEFHADTAGIAIIAIVLSIAAFLIPLVPAHLRALTRRPEIRLAGDRLVLHDPVLFSQDEVVTRNEIEHVQRVDNDWARRLATFRLSPFRERATVAISLTRPRQFPAARTGWYNSTFWSYSRMPQEPIPLPEPKNNYSGFSFRAADPDEAVAMLRTWLARR